MNYWAEVAGIGVAETTVTTTERMHTMGPSTTYWVNNTSIEKMELKITKILRNSMRPIWFLNLCLPLRMTQYMIP